jgi:beta-lactamase regulating signal transducer with metallopeptidase domain
MLWWLAQNAVMAAILAGIVALVCRAVGLRPAVRHALWLVVLLKLVTPPVVHWPWPGLPAVPLSAGPERLPPDAAILDATAPAPPPAAETAAWTLLTPDVAAPPAAALPAPPAADPAPVAVSGSWPALLVATGGVLWLAGTVAVMALELLRIVRFRLRVGRGRPAPHSLVREMEELADRFGLPPPELVVLPDLASPMVWGLGRAQLLWPARLLEGLPPSGRRAVLAHELAHLKRRDHWVGWLELAAACLWWWYPLFWYVRGQLRREAELACDAWVVALLPEARRVYAEALLEVARVGSGVAVAAPALGVVGRRQDFARRLTMIMRECVPYRVSACGLLAVVVLALAALPNWSLGQPDTTPTTQPKQEAPAPQPAASGSVPIALDVGFPVAQPAAEEPQDPARPARQEKRTTARAQPAGTTATLAQPSTPGASPDRDRRLKELEDKLEALLKEIKDLRGGGHASAVTTAPAAGLKTSTTPSVPSTPSTSSVPANAQGVTFTWTSGQTVNVAEPHASVTLSRASYKLGKEKAEALSTFLREHVKAQVLETKVEGENFIVTTTPDAQRVIGQFVALIEGKPLTPAHGTSIYTPASQAK